jgi:hypothetical protein
MERSAATIMLGLKNPNLTTDPLQADTKPSSRSCMSWKMSVWCGCIIAWISWIVFDRVGAESSTGSGIRADAGVLRRTI